MFDVDCAIGSKVALIVSMGQKGQTEGCERRWVQNVQETFSFFFSLKFTNLKLTLKFKSLGLEEPNLQKERVFRGAVPSLIMGPKIATNLYSQSSKF